MTGKAGNGVTTMPAHEYGASPTHGGSGVINGQFGHRRASDAGPRMAGPEPSADVVRGHVATVFPDFDGDQVAELCAIGQLRAVSPETVICSPSKALPGLTILIEGQLSLEQDGHKITDFQPGAHFGEGTLLRETPPAVVIRADTPVWVLVLSPRELNALIDRDPVFGTRILRALCTEVLEKLEATNVLFAENKALNAELDARNAQLEQALVSLKEAHTSIVQEVAERQRSEAQIKHLATHDTLTGVANRALFNEFLALALSNANRHDTKFAVFFIDLDGFKEINDVYGHEAGDVLLKGVASRLKQCTRAYDTVARMGGDEFAILQTSIHEPADIAVLAERVIAAMTQPVEWDGPPLVVSGSIGIAVYPDDGTESADLVRHADLAMYQAKRSGPGQYCFFETEMAQQVNRLNIIKRDLRDAIDAEAFVLSYQPKIEIATGRLVGMEALVRWQQAPEIIVEPEEFLPVAERTGMILPLGEWVLKEACRQMQAWRGKGLADGLRLAVNLSPLQFRRQDVGLMIDAMLDRTGLPADALELELTETAIMHDCQSVVSTLNSVRARGVTLAVDDFGTGYSSLSYLKKFSSDVVKIDRSFVTNVPTQGDDTLISRAIITLAHSLGMKVVAEGIEDATQYEFFREAGCDEAQGFFVSPPLAAREFEEFAAAWRAQDGLGELEEMDAASIAERAAMTGVGIRH